MLLNLNYGFKWLLNRVPKGLQVLPDCRGASRGAASAVSDRDDGFLCGGKPVTLTSSSRFFSPFWNCLLYLVKFPAQGGFRDLLPPFAQLDSFTGHIQAPDVEPGYSLGLWRPLIWVWGRLEKLLVYKSFWGSGRDGEEMHREKRESVRN